MKAGVCVCVYFYLWCSQFQSEPVLSPEPHVEPHSGRSRNRRKGAEEQNIPESKAALHPRNSGSTYLFNVHFLQTTHVLIIFYTQLSAFWSDFTLYTFTLLLFNIITFCYYLLVNV